MMKFYEIDVTDFEKVQLVKIFCTLNCSMNGWKDKIVNLEMIVNDEGQIIIRGWATKKVWEKFLKALVNNDSLNYVYETTIIKDFYNRV